MRPRTALIALTLLITVLLSACTEKQAVIQTPAGIQYSAQEKAISQPLIITKEGPIDQAACTARGLDKQIVVLHKEGCPACKQVVPILHQIETETNIQFNFIDIKAPEGIAELNRMNLNTAWTPTLIVDCYAYINVRSKENYAQIIEGFLKP